MAAAQPEEARVVKFPARPVWQIAMAAGTAGAGIFAGRYLPQARRRAAIRKWRSCAGRWKGCGRWWRFPCCRGNRRARGCAGVTYSEQISQPDRQVLDALLQAVNHDSNVNVRLSAVDALQKFAADPELTRAMVDSIPVQDTPLVQIALIDMLVQLNARGRDARTWRGLSKNLQLDEMVRQRAAWALHKMETER